MPRKLLNRIKDFSKIPKINGASPIEGFLSGSNTFAILYDSGLIVYTAYQRMSQTTWNRVYYLYDVAERKGLKPNAIDANELFWGGVD